MQLLYYQIFGLLLQCIQVQHLLIGLIITVRLNSQVFGCFLQHNIIYIIDLCY